MPMPRKQVERTCLGCGITFFVRPSVVSYGMGKYHSRACFQASKLAPQEGRTCTVCHLYKIATEFDSNPQQRKRLRPECKDCRRARARDYAARTREQRRAYRLLSQFGVTLDEYARLMALQSGRCAICGTEEPGSGFMYLPVDHDHASGAVRGLLCATCNAGLGNFRDNPSLLRAAIDYLADPPATREVDHVPTGSDIRGDAGQRHEEPDHPSEHPGDPPG